jgi:cystathionine gamma-lyase
MVWSESPTNPTLRLIDVARIAKIVHSHPSNPIVVVDNTFLSPFFSSPLLQGADIVVHSLTKYINGHSDVVMGAAILPAHHEELASRIRFLQNAIGAIPSAYDCWLAMRGAKTLHLRMKTHGTSALSIARFLEGHHLVESVIYPGLASSPRFTLANKMLSPVACTWLDKNPQLLQDGLPFGGMISFRIKGDGNTAERFLTTTKLFTLAESLGGVESLAELPAKMTHGSIPPAAREQLGITDNLIRLSVGVEEVEDLIEDIEQAIHYATEGYKTEIPTTSVLKTKGLNGFGPPVNNGMQFAPVGNGFYAHC